MSINCTYCQQEIINIYVLCYECQDYQSCLTCYANGAEIGSHLNSHDYQLRSSCSILSKCKSNWNSSEEIHLLDAIEQFGFGNWEDISKHIESKNSDETRNKYINNYLEGFIGLHTWSLLIGKRPSLIDHTESDNGPLGFTSSQRFSELDINRDEASFLGYLLKRRDFEREYDCTAEAIVSGLALQPEDKDADFLLKFSLMDVYGRKIRERVRRKRIAHDYQLATHFFRGILSPFKQTRDQREFRERLRTFAQFYSQYEFECLVSSLERERSLRIRLSELYRYRANGIKLASKAVHFEQHLIFRGKVKDGSGPFGHGRTYLVNMGTGDERSVGIMRQQFTGQPRLKKVIKKLEGAIEANFFKSRKKRKGRLRFHRPKNHVPHRRPGLIRRIIAHSKLLSK